jgi:gluconokinase
LGVSEIYSLLGPAQEVVASGEALLRGPGWTQMMADALNRPVIACVETEASCRGAALWAMEQAGIIKSVADLPASTGGIFEPRPQAVEAFQHMREARSALYEKLFGPR